MAIAFVAVNRHDARRHKPFMYRYFASVSVGRSRDWRPQGADFFDLESPRASHGAPRGSRITKGVEGNEMVAIWPEKNGPVLQQCTCGVPPRSYFAQ